MKALIQRVKRVSVTIGGEVFSSINSGILIFLGVEKSDEKLNAEKLALKILNLRIYPKSKSVYRFFAENKLERAYRFNNNYFYN